MSVAPGESDTARAHRRAARARKVLLLALLWGVGVAASESAALPWQQLAPSTLLSFALYTTAAWSSVGLLVVSSTAWAVPRCHPAMVLAGYLLLVAPLLALGHNLYLRHFGGYIADADGAASFSYLLWCTSVHGVLLVAWWIVAERAETTRRLLADAQIARQRSEAELDGARLLALRGQVDPAFVREVMTEVQERYAVHAEAADRLLDLLVAFLRGAMPAVRHQRSSLAGEVAVVRAWSALLREREGGTVAWNVIAPGHLPELPFPPLLLLPMLEQLGRGASAAAPPELHVRIEARAAVLECRTAAGAPALDANLEFRLRVALQAEHGQAWTLRMRGSGSGGPALALTLPLAGEAFFVPSTPGVLHAR